MTERFSASNAKKHMACHASADLPRAIPGYTPPVIDKEIGGAAQAGTDVHKVIEDLLAIKTVTKSGVTKFNAKDMIAVGRILTYLGELWSTRRFKVTNEVPADAVWLDRAANEGYPSTTADIVFSTQDELHIVDVKWGKIKVEVFDNKQLLYYAATYSGLAPKAKKVTVHILQPRADNMESWTFDTFELMKFMDEARAADNAIRAGDTTFGPGDHCLFCPAYPHARIQKGTPLCPATLDLLYPGRVDTAAMLADE